MDNRVIPVRVREGYDIVIGGGLSASREWIVDPAVAKVRKGATFHRVPPIVPARFGVWAGAWGAVLAAERAALRV